MNPRLLDVIVFLGCGILEGLGGTRAGSAIEFKGGGGLGFQDEGFRGFGFRGV